MAQSKISVLGQTATYSAHVFAQVSGMGAWVIIGAVRGFETD